MIVPMVTFAQVVGPVTNGGGMRMGAVPLVGGDVEFPVGAVPGGALLLSDPGPLGAPLFVNDGYPEGTVPDGVLLLSDPGPLGAPLLLNDGYPEGAVGTGVIVTLDEGRGLPLDAGAVVLTDGRGVTVPAEGVVYAAGAVPVGVELLSEPGPRGSPLFENPG